MRARALVVAAVLLVGGACSSGDGLTGVSSDKAPGDPASQVVTNIPPPGAVARQAPPELPDRGAGMPPDTINLEELHRQGQTDVVR